MKSFSFAALAVATFAVLATTTAAKKTGKDWQKARNQNGIELSSRPVECPKNKPGSQCLYVDPEDAKSSNAYIYDIFPVNGADGSCRKDYDEPADSLLVGQKAHTHACYVRPKQTWVVTCNPSATKYVVVSFQSGYTTFTTHGGAKAGFGKGDIGNKVDKYVVGHHKVHKKSSVVVKCPPRPHRQ